MQVLILRISRKWRQIVQTWLLPTNRKSHKAFSLAYINIWHWLILKVNVKVMHISIVNFSQIVTEKENIAIDNK